MYLVIDIALRAQNQLTIKCLFKCESKAETSALADSTLRGSLHWSQHIRNNFVRLKKVKI